MDNPEGKVTYPDKQDGWATYQLWHISLHALRFYLCFYIVVLIIKKSFHSVNIHVAFIFHRSIHSEFSLILLDFLRLQHVLFFLSCTMPHFLYFLKNSIRTFYSHDPSLRKIQCIIHSYDPT